VVGHSVARGLQVYADGEDAAATVVGCPERAGAGRIEVGTVAQHLLYASPCAVALAPRAYGARPADGFRRIVVGYNDSDEARAALRGAAGLGHACGATVRVVSVIAHSGAGDGAAQADLDRALRGLASTVATEGLVLDGDPVGRLLEQAEAWADLIVVGSRGYGPVRQVLLGSVAAGLLRSAKVPVIVTPRGVDAELVAAPPVAAAADG
jgi:nucleotide-binding universal stress UspA family protein